MTLLQISVLLLLALVCATFGAECNDNSDCVDSDPCTTNICDVLTDECNFEPITGCIKCPDVSGIVGCFPLGECYVVQCKSNSSSPCENLAIECSDSKNFTSLGVMLALVAIYIIAMIFAVIKDRREAKKAGGKRKSVLVNDSKSSDDHSVDLERRDKRDEEEKMNDDGCCECCGDSSEKSKRGDGKAEKETGCCGLMKLFLCNQPFTLADKITILLCMVFLNIVLSAGLNEKGVAPSRGQQYVIGLISGSVGIPVKTMVTMFFGKVPKKYFVASYGLAYSLCIACFVITIVYTLEFQQAKANNWLVSTGISTLEDICFIAFAFAFIYFCPACSCVVMPK